MNVLGRALILGALAILGAGARADEAPVGMVDQPCPPPFTPPAALREQIAAVFLEPHTVTPAEFDAFLKSPQLAQLNEASRQRAAQDWAGLCRFREANAAVLASHVAPRVVFMGDSITELWGTAEPDLFAGDLINRGISGQTSAQMLLRFQADVVALEPKRVHILAGTNDVAGNTGPTRPQDFENNIVAMVEIAKANGIAPILGSIPPAAAFSWRPDVKPVPTIAALNAWMRDYAASQGLPFIDYYHALVGAKGELKAELSNDGVHPNRSGFRIMRRLLEQALAEPRASSGAQPAASSVSGGGRPAAGAALRAGAARVDITPDPGKLPKGFEGINDRIFVRAIVVDDGRSRAALVTVDAGAIGTDTWSQVSAQAEKDLQIPASHLLLTATHTHSVPFGNSPDLAPRIVAAISQAAARLQPVRIAYGTGVSYINVNRNLIDPQTHRWWEGPNYSGASDKTVAVVRFETPAGRPVAVYYNYAVHGVLNGQLDQISGDIPGAASRYIEDSLGDDAIAVWSTGASGDQNPIYFQQTYDLREIRIKEYAARGIDISNVMPPGGQGLNKRDPKVAKLMSQQRQMTVSMGQMLGEEVLHVMRSNLERPVSSAQIFGAQKIVSCPGRKRTDTGRAGYPGTYVDADPIPIRLSLLELGDIAIAGVNAEVFTAIGQRLKRESPLKHTMMVTLTNGMARSGYIPDDAAFGYNTFEVVSSSLKPGCAETAITDGLLDLIGAADAAGRGGNP